MEDVEVDISCQTDDLGNVIPMLGLTRLGLAAQSKAGVETVLHIVIALDVLTTDLVGYHSTQSVYHCCLAPCKSVPNYGPLTEPKIYIVKFGRTAIPALNGRISETKRDFLNSLVPKFSYDRGLSPTLS